MKRPVRRKLRRKRSPANGHALQHYVFKFDQQQVDKFIGGICAMFERSIEGGFRKAFDEHAKALNAVEREFVDAIDNCVEDMHGAVTKGELVHKLESLKAVYGPIKQQIEHIERTVDEVKWRTK